MDFVVIVVLMNPVGKFVVRLNWYLKRTMLSSASFKFVSLVVAYRSIFFKISW